MSNCTFDTVFLKDTWKRPDGMEWTFDIERTIGYPDSLCVVTGTLRESFRGQLRKTYYYGYYPVTHMLYLNQDDLPLGPELRYHMERLPGSWNTVWVHGLGFPHNQVFRLDRKRKSEKIL